MINDIRIYNYNDESPLINRTTQIKEYLDSKLSNVKANVDFTEVKETIITSTDSIKDSINESTETIEEAIEDARPCLCNLATKSDVCNAKNEIIKEIDEKFVDLNEIIKSN